MPLENNVFIFFKKALQHQFSFTHYHINAVILNKRKISRELLINIGHLILLYPSYPSYLQKLCDYFMYYVWNSYHSLDSQCYCKSVGLTAFYVTAGDFAFLTPPVISALSRILGILKLCFVHLDLLRENITNLEFKIQSPLICGMQNKQQGYAALNTLVDLSFRNKNFPHGDTRMVFQAQTKCVSPVHWLNLSSQQIFLFNHCQGEANGCFWGAAIAKRPKDITEFSPLANIH